jgi:hypothetical protein
MLPFESEACLAGRVNGQFGDIMSPGTRKLSGVTAEKSLVTISDHHQDLAIRQSQEVAATHEEVATSLNQRHLVAIVTTAPVVGLLSKRLRNTVTDVRVIVYLAISLYCTRPLWL